MKAPLRCPMCKEFKGWIKVDSTHKGFSVGKAVVGTAVGHVIGGPAVGLLGGALGKKKKTYACRNCGFQHEYDG